ncbi:MAG: hypothetical protein JKY19_00590 [Alcanivoracaceae bacterium]|nr:hypothetical protein [Alcanivoracaceae bacterium]
MRKYIFKSKTLLVISMLCFFTACATVERMPLSKEDSKKMIYDNNLVIYFYDEAPEKSRIVREVVISKYR